MQGNLQALEGAALTVWEEEDDGTFAAETTVEDLADAEALDEVPVEEGYAYAETLETCYYRCYPVGGGRYICFVEGTGTGCIDYWYYQER